jgi:flagellar protein FlaG
MFEALSNTIQPAPLRVKPMEIDPAQIEPAPKLAQAPDSLASKELHKEPTEPQAEQAVSEDFLKGLEAEIESLHNVGLQFAKHDQSGRTMIRIVNKDNGNTLREIPSEKLLDLAAKLDEMLGILFDKTV